MSDPKNPVPGDQHIDASELSLVDLTPEAMHRFIKVRDGIDKAVASLKRLDSGQIERAGLNAGDVARAIAIAEQHGKIDAMIPAAEKLAEMLMETRAARGHELATLLGEIASQARRRGERDAKGPEILGPLAELLAYQYGPAQRSAATRAKTSAKGEPADEQEEATTG
jgi:hypothetical protein